MSPQLRHESTTLVCKRAIEFISQQIPAQEHRKGHTAGTKHRKSAHCTRDRKGR